MNFAFASDDRARRDAEDRVTTTVTPPNPRAVELLENLAALEEASVPADAPLMRNLDMTNAARQEVLTVNEPNSKPPSKIVAFASSSGLAVILGTVIAFSWNNSVCRIAKWLL